MEITDSIINRYRQSGEDIYLVGVCGRAGAGKTTITNKIAKLLKVKGINSIAYSGDWRFKLDSTGRKQLLHDKWVDGLVPYITAINQFTWWDFDKIAKDLGTLVEGEQLVIKDAYNRVNGKKELIVKHKIKKGVIFYESNILGGVEILHKLDLIILLNTPDQICFERLIKKDIARRSLNDIAARWMVITYSENMFYQMLLDKFYHKIIVCDGNGKLGKFPELTEVTQIPIPIR
jgi:uridine kinase